MGWRDPGEPEFPSTLEEVKSRCDRLVEALRAHLGVRLIGVLLCGSWARGEARPPESDMDLTVIVDIVDTTALRALRQAWEAAEAGPANVYGLDEVPLLPREGLEQFTTNAVLCWGANPFAAPTRQDFARDLASACEDIARYARSALIYPWLTQEKAREIKWAFGKTGLRWALRCLAAFRTAEFPRNQAEVRRRLQGSPEELLLDWSDHLTDEELGSRAEQIALQLNEFTRSWLTEIGPCLAEPDSA